MQAATSRFSVPVVVALEVDLFQMSIGTPNHSEETDPSVGADGGTNIYGVWYGKCDSRFTSSARSFMQGAFPVILNL